MVRHLSSKPTGECLGLTGTCCNGHVLPDLLQLEHGEFDMREVTYTVWGFSYAGGGMVHVRSRYCTIMNIYKHLLDQFRVPAPCE